VSEKVAYSPCEFAKLFGKERTWAYRLLQKGKLAKISGDFGNILIPASEVTRLLHAASPAKISNEIAGLEAPAIKSEKPSPKVAEPTKGGGKDWKRRIAGYKGGANPSALRQGLGRVAPSLPLKRLLKHKPAS